MHLYTCRQDTHIYKVKTFFKKNVFLHNNNERLDSGYVRKNYLAFVFILERGFYCVSLTSLDLRALPASASCFRSTGTEGALQAHSGLQTQHRATRLVQPFDSRVKENS